MTPAMIAVGNFFFRYRNQAFPLIILVLAVLAPPPTTWFGSTAGGHFRETLAMAIVAFGLTLRATVIGFAYIQRGGLRKRVYAKELVTEGMFGVCRNPLYAGNMLIYSGIFLFHGDAFVVVAGIVLFALIYQCIVLAEEHFLLDKFPDGYRAYCRDVPRWGFRLQRFRRSTEGMRFNVRRVIAKDYSTISAALLALLAVDVYRVLTTAETPQSSQRLLVLALLVMLVVASTGIVSRMKKSGRLDEPAAFL
ncbi:protein-S-isoprenylcysteine O-methyltransferase Ste14 [Rhizobium subbaraonis]|uniref:Protein-S-isoprenylcysteine O-methyltransferase Ste14 n=1 Tax=Rhizobium subbaraonis TaxID=908946 RepID=A0A285U2J6_9HYPH|nr:isoprenylcysteine carboxylmethyltransferase family protein [Rhizobium subbaraonis]SOC36145.1 protein-S-isoprenylcysteine O-methyltransferase Ste14 [Rhizobium subbaraonis]